MQAMVPVVLTQRHQFRCPECILMDMCSNNFPGNQAILTKTVNRFMMLTF